MVRSVDVEAAKDRVEGPNIAPPGLQTAEYAVESSSKLWSVYLTESERHDKALAESWKSDMDGLLIFAGLFSAVVTAFLVGSLQQMTQSNQAPGSTPTPINLSSLSRASALWCSSLLSSLLSALCATLVQQWARQYTQALGRRTAAYQRARVRAFLLQGIERSGAKALVEGAPALLHLAMFLFMAGLIDFTGLASRTISLLSLGVLISTAVFYLALSCFPLHNLQSPYRTPLSSALWYVKQAVRPLKYINLEGSSVTVNSSSLTHGREEYAAATADGTRERDLASLSWALSSLIDRDDCEPFIEGIAGFMRSEKAVEAPIIMHELVKREDLVRHVLELLVNCVEPVHDATEIRRRRAISGLSALRALTTNWFSDDAGVTLQDDDPHDVWKWSYSFPARMIDVTISLRSAEDSVISMHARCTIAVAVWRLLIDYDELGAYTKQKLVTVERLLAHLESTRDKKHRGTRRTRVRNNIRDKITHDLLAVWAQSTQKHIETLRMNSPHSQSKPVHMQNWDAEKADLRMMRYLWEQSHQPPEAWLHDDAVLQHNETDSGESSMLDSVLAYLSLHAKLLHRTLKPLESSQQPLSDYVDEATECLHQWSSTAMKELIPRIIVSGHVANVIQLIKHAVLGPRRSEADQVMILETLESIVEPIRSLQGKLNETTQKSLLGLLKFLQEQHLDVVFRDIDNLAGSTYQLLVKIGKAIIPLVIHGLGTPDLWQSAQSALLEYEDACPDLANTLSSAQTWITGKLVHYQLSRPQSRKPLLLLPGPSEPRTALVPAFARRPQSESSTPRKGPPPPEPEPERDPQTRILKTAQYKLLPSDTTRKGDKAPLYSLGGHVKESYIDMPAELEVGGFIDMPQHSRREPAAASWQTWQPSDGNATPEIQPESPSDSSNDSLEYESASSIKLWTPARRLQISTSIGTTITAAETEPSPVSKPAPSPQEGGSRTSRPSLHPSPPIVHLEQPPSPRGLFGPGPPRASESPPTPPRRSNRSPPGRTPPPAREDQGLGLYIPGELGPVPLHSPSTPFYTPIENSTAESSNAQASGPVEQKSVQTRTAGDQDHGERDSPSVDGLALEAPHSGSRAELGRDDGDAGSIGGGGGGGPYGDGDESESVKASTDESPGGDESEGAMAVDKAGEPSSPREAPDLAANIVEPMANVDADAQLGSPSHRSRPSQNVDSQTFGAEESAAT
ncbi:hypothetical protein BJV78DRAFT_405002 [Lactifluus subvellereus]|nr:hypothetical protein BJV78DRAFT_405002 [Lactifluus subvellereus]